MIQLMQLEGQSTAQQERDLQRVERDLRNFNIQATDNVKSMKEMTQEMKGFVASFAEDLGTAMAAAVQGQISAGQAMEKAVGQMIKMMCDHWAKYFSALAIADMWSNPAKAGAELAAAAALEMVGALAGSMGGGGTTGGSQAPSAITITPGPSTATATGPSGGGQNVPHLAAGALVSAPTLAMLAESSKREAVIPLDDPGVMTSIAKAFGKAGGGDIYNHFAIGGMISSTDLTKVGRLITRSVSTGRLRMTVTNSNRITRK
jgi:hypothetical protein